MEKVKASLLTGEPGVKETSCNHSGAEIVPSGWSMRGLSPTLNRTI